MESVMKNNHPHQTLHLLKITGVFILLTFFTHAQAQVNDDAMAKDLMDKISQNKGDIVMRPSDLPPEAPKPKMAPPKANVAALENANSPTPNAGGAPSNGAKVADKDLKHTASAHWNYQAGEIGPENWGKLGKENALCGNGRLQSPINIEKGIQVDLPPLSFDYKPSPLAIQNNGHTILVNYGDGSNLILQGRQYRLIQFHFHQPSEDAIDGKRAQMVAHLVHQHYDGSLLVVAVLLNSPEQGGSISSETDQENRLFQEVLNNIPLTKNVVETPSGVMVDINQLLPKSHAYITYMGSLTTPPCTENVTWVVLKEPMMLSKQQIENFGRIYPNNARPLQATMDRLIKQAR
jgi:carbonic anhydrase